MSPAHIKELTGRLDPGSLTAFVEALLSAEAARLDIARTDLVMSDQITENDAGLDALIRGVPASAPDGTRGHLPPGIVGVQVKATKRKQPAAFDLPTELRKPGPARLLVTGGAYVLVSGQDFNPAQREALENAVQSEATQVVEEEGLTGLAPHVFVWDAQTLALLSQVHPGPAVDIGLYEFGQALSMTELLSSLRADERPFQTDAARDDVIRRVRERARQTGADPLLLMLHGDAGAGKTRTIAEALNTDDLRDLVLYANGNEGLPALTTQLIRNHASRGILFVDEVPDTDVLATNSRLGGLGGRWRLVSCQTRSDRAWLAQGGRNAILPPLDPEATRRLVESFGLPAPLARRVAEVAEGFPQLALRLADELRADPSLDLVRLAHVPSSAELLQRALPDSTVRTHLAPMALFSAVGFEDELSYEVEAVASVFELDLNVLRRVCDAELPRGFVSRAGRYRMVSPRLVAIWLASDLIESIPRFEELLLRLPESLRDAFVRQLEFFGPDSRQLPEALRRVLSDDRFRNPASFTEAAARFLRASAAIVPEQVADAINSLIGRATEDQLKRMPRRDLVWTLQVLLWWPATWDIAVTNLLALAEHETETWANNATATFVGAFPVFLGGTLVPYSHRAAWLERAIDDARPGGLRLLAAAATAGLQTYHVRTVVGFYGGGEPTDWRPSSRDEYVDARRTAWRLVLKIRDTAPPSRRRVFTKDVARCLRSAYQDIGTDVEGAIETRRWSVEERVDLATALREVLMFETLGQPERDRLTRLHDWLVGRGIREQLAVLLRTRPWDLFVDRKDVHEVPPLLVRVADGLARLDERGLELALRAGRRNKEQDTRFSLFRLLAERYGPVVVGEAALSETDWLALSAALSMADQLHAAAWASEALRRVAAAEPERVPELLTFVKVTPERLDLALSLVEHGDAAPGALGRLLFGARIRELDEPSAFRLLRAIANDGMETALGMLDQWVDDHPDPSGDIRGLASQLALRALSADPSPMIAFHVAQLVKANALVPDTLVRLLELRVMNGLGGNDELDELLLSRVLDQAETRTRAILDMVRRVGPRAAITGGDLAVLSRLAAVTSPDEVWHHLSSWPELDLRWGLHHMNWEGEEPDPLVRAFLTSQRVRELEDEAYVCFVNSLGVVRGPYHLALAREVEKARSWLRDLKGTAGEKWASELVAQELRDVEWHRQREAEDNVLLG